MDVLEEQQIQAAKHILKLERGIVKKDTVKYTNQINLYGDSYGKSWIILHVLKQPLIGPFIKISVSNPWKYTYQN